MSSDATLARSGGFSLSTFVGSLKAADPINGQAEILRHSSAHFLQDSPQALHSAT